MVLLTIGVTLFIEYVGFRTWHDKYPDSFGKFLTKLFPPSGP